MTEIPEAAVAGAEPPESLGLAAASDVESSPSPEATTCGEDDGVGMEESGVGDASGLDVEPFVAVSVVAEVEASAVGDAAAESVTDGAKAGVADGAVEATGVEVEGDGGVEAVG